MGLLNGVNGKMLPDNPVKRSEAVVILNRALGASVADSTSGLNSSSQNVWYSEDLGKAIHLGLIEANDSRNFDTAATRAEAFVLIARAFVFDRAEAAADELSAFTDTGSMTDEQLQAAAALAAEGIVNGTSATTLSPAAQLTRAEFVTMVTRVADQIIDSQPAADDDTPAADDTEDTDDSGNRQRDRIGRRSRQRAAGRRTAGARSGDPRRQHHCAARKRRLRVPRFPATWSMQPRRPTSHWMPWTQTAAWCSRARSRPR